MLAVLLVALSLGLSNFAASIGIGISGTGARTRWRVGLAFGLFEAGMPVAGLLTATGLYAVIQSLRSRGQGTGRLLVTGAALSIDNLAVGFALGAYHVSLVLAAAVIGAVSVGLSLAGLELGSRLGARAGRNGEMLGGAVLVGVGVAVAAGVL